MTDASVEKPASPTIHVTAWLLVGLFLVIVVGSYIAKTEIVARGQGRAIPASRVQVVQPQVNGRITAILVEEGQTVKKGDTLVTMDPVAIESEIRRIESGIAQKTQDIAVALSIVEPLSNIDPTDKNFIEAGRAIFRQQTTNVSMHADNTELLVVAALSALRNQVAHIDAQLARIGHAKEAQLVRHEKARSHRQISAKRFESAPVLRERGTISEVDYLERLREFKTVESDVLIAERQIGELAAEVEVMSRQRASAISTVFSNYRKQLNEAEIALRSLQAELKAAHVHHANLSLRAPTDGRIENLSVFTLGGFVQAGATLMSVVPADGELEIEAFFDNRDAGFLATGQKAFVKFDAFPAERFGIVHGRVTNVGADAREISYQKWMYAARLNLDQSAIQIEGRAIEFAPGMTATVDVVTGERRLISFFFEPILKALQDSFGER